jgi:hypothetical protein
MLTFKDCVCATFTLRRRIANLVGDLLQVQRDVRNDATAARAAAVAPKTVAEFFGDHVTDKLLALCQAPNAHALPELWIQLAAANGKREREVIETQLCITAANLGDPELAPVVTPDLAKKIASVRLAGNNMDDFSDGVNPFLMTVQDCTSPSSEKQHFEALFLAADCDALVGGSAAADLADVTKMRTAIKVQVPANFVTMRLRPSRSFWSPSSVRLTRRFRSSPDSPPSSRTRNPSASADSRTRIRSMGRCAHFAAFS